MTTNRLDWSIVQKANWIATYTNGDMLVASSEAKLMSKINQFEKDLKDA